MLFENWQQCMFLFQLYHAEESFNDLLQSDAGMDILGEIGFRGNPMTIKIESNGNFFQNVFITKRPDEIVANGF